jgi:FlaA1/EpsC-like NDP-sugar epimerase
MKPVAIFGCGHAGQRAYLYLKAKYRIVAFLDNNRCQHGARIAGVPVCDPEKFDYSHVEHVFIGSMYLDQILVQLLSLEVPSSKIEYLSDEILMRDHSSHRQSGAFAPFNAVRRAFYVPFRLLR